MKREAFDRLSKAAGFCMRRTLSLLVMGSLGLALAAHMPEVYANDESDLVVSIQGPGDQGTGALIGYHDGRYLVSTSKHVVEGMGKGEYLELTTSDKVNHKVAAKEIRKSNEFDIAFIEFSSSSCYNTFFLSEVAAGSRNGSSPLDSHRPSWQALQYGQEIAISGYASVDPSISDKPIYRKTTGEIAVILPPSDGKQGYSLGYTAPTSRGMSGSPIYRFEQFAGSTPYFHGIHGRAERDAYRQDAKTGMNFGIAAVTVKAAAAKLGYQTYLNPRQSYTCQ